MTTAPTSQNLGIPLNNSGVVVPSTVAKTDTKANADASGSGGGLGVNSSNGADIY